MDEHQDQTRAIERLGDKLLVVETNQEYMMADVNGLKVSSYGPNGTTGVIGSVNELRGSFNMIRILLAGILISAIGLGGYNIKLAMMHQHEMELVKEMFIKHIKLPGHEWIMEQHEKNFHTGPR